MSTDPKQRLTQYEEHRAANLPFAFRDRFDPIWILTAFAGFALLPGLWLLGLVLADRFQWFKPELAQPVRDARILENAQTLLNRRGVVDSIYQEDLDQFLIADGEGALHTYKPGPGLWKSDIADNNLNSSRIHLLGQDPNGPRAWGLTLNNGLLTVDQNGVRLLFGDQPFLSRDGTPVSGSLLSAAALDPETNTLCLGTHAGDIGIYNLHDKNFSQPEWESGFSPIQSVTDIRYGGGKFWVGSDGGLATVESKNGSWHIRAMERRFGGVTAMSRDESGVWVLFQGECRESEGNCRVLQCYQNAGGVFVTVMETAVYPELNLENLYYAAADEDQWIFAGRDGVFRYNPNTHGWKKLFSGRILDADRVDDHIFFGYDGGAGVYKDGVLRLLPLNEQKVDRIRAGDEGSFALTEQGGLFRLSLSGATPIMSPNPSQFDFENTAQTAVWQDYALFGATGQALLHNIRERTYNDLPSYRIPAWLVRAGSKWMTSGDTLYVVSPVEDDQWEAYTLDWNRLARGEFRVHQGPIALSGPPRRIRDLGGQGIGIIDAQGRMFFLSPRDAQSWSGPAAPELDRQKPRDVVLYGEELVFAFNDHIRSYRPRKRAWEEPVPLPDNREPLAVIAFDNRLFVQGDKGTLFMRDAGKLVPVLGSPQAAGIRDEAISDVTTAAGDIWIGGDGKVTRYDPGLGRFDPPFILESGPVRIADVVEKGVLTLNNRNAFLNDSVIDEDAGPVEDLFTHGDHVWTRRIRRGTPYLKIYPKQTPGYTGTCYGRRPDPGIGINRIFDAVPLEDGWIAAATDGGLRFYNSEFGSWWQPYQDPIPKGGKLFIYKNNLVTHGDNGPGRVAALIPIKSIKYPHACSDENVVFSPSFINAEDIAVSADGNRLALLNQDGGLIEYRAGSRNEILPVIGNLPRLENLRRFFPDPESNRLFFSESGGLWVYDLEQRRWSFHEPRLGNPNASAGEVNIQRIESRYPITVRTENGRLLSGEFQAEDHSLDLVEFFRPSYLPLDPSSPLRDLQDRRDGLWTFVFEDRLRYFDPLTARFSGEVYLGGDKDKTYYMALDRGIVRAGNTLWVAKSKGAAPADFAKIQIADQSEIALDARGHIYQLEVDGTLQVAEMQQSGQNFQAFQEKFAPGPQVFDDTMVFPWFDTFVFHDSRNGIRIWDKNTRRILNINNKLGQGKPGPSAFEYEDKLWLQFSDDLFLIKRDGDQITAIRFPAGRRLGGDRIGREWLKTRDGVKIHRGGDRLYDPSQNGERVSYIAGQDPAAMDDQEHLYIWNESGTVRDDAPRYPGGRNILRHWFRGIEGTWWGLSNRELILLKNESGILQERFRTALPGSMQNGTTPAFARLNADGGLDLWGIDGEQLKITGDSNPVAEILSARLPNQRDQIENEWPELKAHVRERNGLQRFNPILSLEVGENGQLLAVTPLERLEVAELGAITFELPEPLSSPSIRWNRDRARLTLGSGTEARTLANPADWSFIDIHAVVFDPRGTLYAAGPEGLLSFPDGEIRLDQTFTFQPKDWRGKNIEAEGDGFRVGSQRLDPQGRALTESTRNFDYQNLNFTFDANGVRASIRGSTETVSADSGYGFPWDRKRRTPAYIDGQLFLATEAGIGPADRFQDWITEQSIRNARLHNTAGEPRALVQTPRGFWWLGSGILTAQAGNPLENRVLFDGDLGWRLNDGRVVMESGDRDYNIIAGMNRILFDKDLVEGSAATKDGVFVATRAGMFRLHQISDIGAGRGTLFEEASGSLSVPRGADGETVLIRENRDGSGIWRNGRFEPIDPENDPRRNRVLAQTTAFQFQLENGAVRKYIRFQTATGKEGRRAFSWRNGNFPTDQVLSLAEHENELWVGTAAGLRIFKNKPGQSTPPPVRLIHGDHPEAVTRIGRHAESGSFLVETESGIYQPNNQSFEPIATTSNWPEQSHEDHLWSWRRDPVAGLKGFYRDSEGKPETTAVTLAEGRFPHDRIQDFDYQDQQLFLLWENGKQSTFNQLEILPKNEHSRQNWQQVGPRAYLRLPDHGERFLEGATGYHRIEGDQLQGSVSGDLQTRLEAEKRRPTLYRQGNLNLRGVEKPAFNLVSENGRETVIPWRNGKLAVDVWRDFLIHHSRVIAATPAGLVGFVQNKHRIELDPDQFFINDQINQFGSDPEVTDLAVFGNRLVLRCRGASPALIQAELGPEGLDADSRFQAKSDGEDPFREKRFTGSDPRVSWRLVGREIDRPGRLEALFLDEPVQFVGGRFSFDAFTDMTAFGGSLLIAGRESGARVLYNNQQTPVGSRPQWNGVDPAVIETVGIGSDGDLPALVVGSGAYHRIQENGDAVSIAVFRERLADDGFRRFERENDQLLISAPAEDGSRVGCGFQDGRFNDDRILALPLQENQGYLIATKAGPLYLDEALQKNKLIAGPFQGIEKDQTPQILFHDNGKVRYLGSGGIYDFQRGLIKGFSGIEGRILDWQPYLDGLYKVRGTRNGRITTHLVSAGDFAVLPENRHLFLVDSVSAYQTHRGNLQDDPWLTMDPADQVLFFSDIDGKRQRRFDIPFNGRFIAAHQHRDHLYITTQGGLWRINLNQVLINQYR